MRLRPNTFRFKIVLEGAHRPMVGSLDCKQGQEDTWEFLYIFGDPPQEYRNIEFRKIVNFGAPIFPLQPERNGHSKLRGLIVDTFTESACLSSTKWLRPLLWTRSPCLLTQTSRSSADFAWTMKDGVRFIRILSTRSGLARYVAIKLCCLSDPMEGRESKKRGKRKLTTYCLVGV